MKVRILQIKILTVLLLGIFTFTSTAYAASPLDEVRELLQRYYVDELDEEILEEPTIEEMLEHLDPYTAYLTKEELQTFVDSIEQSYVGIGIMIEKGERGVRVTNVFPNSPAAQSGILIDDELIAINGEETAEMELEEVTGKIKGEAGTTVMLTLQHAETITPYIIQLTRENIQLSSVTAEKLGGNIGYMNVSVFNEQTVPEMKKALREMEDVKKWIVDLRNNPGGYVTASQRMIGLFPEVKNALIVESRVSNYTLPAFVQTTQFQRKPAVLVNDMSASASEVVAGAVKDANAATLYGETTYGKGLMQALYELSDESALKISNARFYTPKHNKINEQGIDPDVETETPLVDAHLAMLLEDYKEYHGLEPLEKIDPEKAIDIRFTQPIDKDTISTDTIQLIELGGGEVDYTSQLIDKRTLSIQSTDPLKAGSQYILVVHPNWKTTSKETASQGIYVQVLVNE
ncbi:S41 family peptidase [Bacillus solimangrovi]|uniref:PDZ domain-containing protein n=1 Tax=Bacillus solimangrovi TaxID=1305675 RepID=A0A1E5LE87_9BACI|nr:S41 family peptidase [Bacillus solimangrovi]OEH92386.1 hypothetical protein BFG57_16220 [Bacillus solimangrovi]